MIGHKNNTQHREDFVLFNRFVLNNTYLLHEELHARTVVEVVGDLERSVETGEENATLSHR